MHFCQQQEKNVRNVQLKKEAEAASIQRRTVQSCFFTFISVHIISTPEKNLRINDIYRVIDFKKTQNRFSKVSCKSCRFPGQLFGQHSFDLLLNFDYYDCLVQMEETDGKEKNCLASDNRERGHKCCSKFCICSSKNGDMTFTSGCHFQGKKMYTHYSSRVRGRISPHFLQLLRSGRLSIH